MLEVQICTRTGRLLRSYAIGDEAEVILGRDASCDIHIDSAQLDAEHCAIETSEGTHVLRDLHSQSGTFVDGHRIDMVTVRQGLEAIIGPAMLRFIDDEADEQNDES